MNKDKVISMAISIPVNALNLPADFRSFGSAIAPHENIVAIIDGVAGKLGNTRAVCKKYYIHPQLR
jgi:DNA topoisomerase-1